VRNKLLRALSRPRERGFQPINTAPLSEPYSFGDAFLGDTVFQTWLSVSSLPGVGTPRNNVISQGIKCTAALLSEVQHSLFQVITSVRLKVIRRPVHIG